MEDILVAWCIGYTIINGKWKFLRSQSSLSSSLICHHSSHHHLGLCDWGLRKPSEYCWFFHFPLKFCLIGNCWSEDGKFSIRFLFNICAPMQSLLNIWRLRQILRKLFCFKKLQRSIHFKGSIGNCCNKLMKHYLLNESWLIKVSKQNEWITVEWTTVGILVGDLDSLLSELLKQTLFSTVDIWFLFYTFWVERWEEEQDNQNS